MSSHSKDMGGAVLCVLPWPWVTNGAPVRGVSACWLPKVKPFNIMCAYVRDHGRGWLSTCWCACSTVVAAVAVNLLADDGVEAHGRAIVRASVMCVPCRCGRVVRMDGKGTLWHEGRTKPNGGRFARPLDAVGGCALAVPMCAHVRRPKTG